MDLDSQVGKSLALVGVALVALWVFRSKRPSKHFSLAELTTTSTGLSNVPGLAARGKLEKLANEVLEPLRDRFGAIRVNSGYRSPAVNQAVGGAGGYCTQATNPKCSSHTSGNAADVEALDGTPASTLAAWLYDSDLPLNQVIIYWNTGHLHVARDEGPKPYRRDFKQTYDGKNYEAWKPGGRQS